MAFTIANWGRSSTTANEGVVTLTGGVKVGCFREYNYFSPTDAQGVIATAGYFNAVAGDLAVDDRISAALTGVVSTTYRVVSITANPTVVTIATP